MSQDAKNVAQIMKTRFNRFNIPERDADYTLFADAQPVRNGPSGAVDKAINKALVVFNAHNLFAYDFFVDIDGSRLVTVIIFEGAVFIADVLTFD